MSEGSRSEHAEKRVIRHESCSLAVVRRVAAMLDYEPGQWSEGDVLPRGWQFILLGADTRRSALREDGFPGIGVELPDLGLPRLMLGGRTVRYDGDVYVGATLRRESWMQKVAHKETANGPMAIVTVAHELYPAEAASPVIVETQNYLLLSAQSAGRKSPQGPRPPVDPPQKTKRVIPDETLLFQYSALGFNSHRIHFDKHFARTVEGFPDLVVNGGVTTLLLTEFLRTELGATLTAFTARHVAPLFCGRAIELGATIDKTKCLLRAFDDTGVLAVDVEAEVV